VLARRGKAGYKTN